MNITFFNRGIGGGDGPVDYCTNEYVPSIITIVNSDGNLKSKVHRDESGNIVLKQRIPPPEILRGDSERTRQLIDSIDNTWKYTSGVAAFAIEDAPTEAQQNEFMDKFEEAAFPGLGVDRRDILWTRHTHEGNVELHFVIPRIDIKTGLAYNPAPPGWEKLYGPLRDHFNWKFGWARPDVVGQPLVPVGLSVGSPQEPQQPGAVEPVQAE